MGSRRGIITRNVRRPSKCDDDGDGRVLEGDGAVRQALIQEGDRLLQVEVRRLCEGPLHDEVVDGRGGEQDGL